MIEDNDNFNTREKLFANISQVNDNIYHLMHANRPFLTYEIIQNVAVLSELVEAYNELFPYIKYDDVKGD